MVKITSDVMTVTHWDPVTNTPQFTFFFNDNPFLLSGHQGYYQLFILSSPLQGWRSNFTIFNRLVFLCSQQPPSLRN